MSELPLDTTLNIASLAKAFDNATNSYKFLWMLGILDVLEEKEKQKEEKEQKEQTPNADNGRIWTRDIVERMLITADVPLNRYRLFFGAGDRMKEHIEKWREAQKEDDNALKGLSGDKAEKALMNIREELTRFVPMQFMTPFFGDKGKLPQKSGKRAKEIRGLAMEHFSDTATQPLYRMGLKPRPLYIEMHPEWRKYLLLHREIIRGWVRFHWIKHLQSRNPYALSIINKIAPPPDKREDMLCEREWWSKIIQKCGGVTCIYSDTEILPGDEFQLDHYVPWSQVQENRLWNLIPTTGSANASKSDRLPKREKYFCKFVQMQYNALQISQNICGDYKNITGAYSDELKIKIDPPPEMDKLRAAYSIVIPLLINLARARGFSEWEHSASSPK